jgi:hypothetical protein
MAAKLGTFLKVSLAGTLFPVAGFVGYRKRQIWEMERKRREEVLRLDAELDRLVPSYRKQIAAQERALQEAQEAEALKVTLWEDRLRRFREETAAFLTYAAAIPAQLQELEELNKLYWVVDKVLRESGPAEARFEATCRKIHESLLAGHTVLFDPDAVTARGDLAAALEAVQRATPDPLVDRLAAAAQHVESSGEEDTRRMEAAFQEGLRLIEETQFSVSGPERNDLTARVLGKAQQSLRFPGPLSAAADLTAGAPRRILSEGDLQRGLRFAEDFLKAAGAGELRVAVTHVPINATPEGADAIRHMEEWAASARAYIGMRQLTKAFHAHLLAQAVRLGLPEVAPPAP